MLVGASLDPEEAEAEGDEREQDEDSDHKGISSLATSSSCLNRTALEIAWHDCKMGRRLRTILQTIAS